MTGILLQQCFTSYLPIIYHIGRPFKMTFSTSALSRRSNRSSGGCHPDAPMGTGDEAIPEHGRPPSGPRANGPPGGHKGHWGLSFKPGLIGPPSRGHPSLTPGAPKRTIGATRAEKRWINGIGARPRNRHPRGPIFSQMATGWGTRIHPGTGRELPKKKAGDPRKKGGCRETPFWDLAKIPAGKPFRGEDL